MRNWLDKYETAGQVMVTSQTTKSPKTGKCKDGYGCHGNSSSQTGFGMDMGLGDAMKSGTGFDNWKDFNTPVGWNDLLTYNSNDLTGKDLKQYNKDITARTKSLQSQYPGVTEEQVRVAGGDSVRIRQRMGDLKRYDQPSEQTFDKAYHQFYRPLMNQSTPVTIPQILQYQSQQPGGLNAFQQMVTGNYGRKKAKYGGGLLSRKVTCSDCGWSWQGVEGGKDPITCHNCGGMIKMKSGGDISITDLEAGSWLDRYEVAGQVTNTTTRPPYSFASYQMPRQTNDSNSGLDRRKEVVLKTTANKVNETNAAVANFRKNNAWAANLSNNEIVNRIAMQNNSMKNQGTIKKAGPKQSVASKTWEAVSHPMTAINYAVNNQRIPDNFSKGETNILDNAVNILNPATYINAGVNLAKDIMPGPGIEMSNSKDHKPALLNTLAKAGVNAFTNLVGDGNVYEDGSNERTMSILGNAMTVLPIGAELKPFLGKTFSSVNNAIKTRPFLNRMIYGAPEEAGMFTARSSVGPQLNWDRQALAAQRAKAKQNTSLFGESFDNSKLSQREFQKVVEGPSGMQHDVGYGNYPSSRDYDFQRTFAMRGKDDPGKGYLKFDLWKEKGNEYPELGDFSFFNNNKVSASDHIKMMMGNLPKKVHMPAAGDERLFSMYSQPIINANVSRLAGTPGRITVKPTGKSSVLNTGYLEGPGDENFLLQASKQFPRLQKSYKSLSDYTGTKFPEPKMYVDNKLVTAEDLLSPELQQRMLDSKFSYTKPEVFRIEVPDYSIHKNFKQGGWLDNYANGGMIQYGPGGQTTDGCPANYYKNAQGQCVPEYNANFTMPRNATSSTAITYNTPKGQVSTATTGQTKENVAAGTKAMGKGILAETNAKKARVKERQDAKAFNEGTTKTFTMPDGRELTLDQMTWRDKSYVAGKSLEGKGRINENDETWYDDYLNPINWVTGMAGALGTAPYQAKQSGSNMPYLSAILNPLIGGRMMGSGSINPLGKQFWTNEISNKAFLNNMAGGIPGMIKGTAAKVGQSMESGLLSKAHNINPYQWKPKPTSAYRMIGNEEGLANAVESGYLKPSTKGSDLGTVHTISHYTMGAPSDGRKYFGRTWNREFPGPYMAEVPNAVNDVRISKGTFGKEMGADVFTFPENYIPTSEANLYKKHWLQGYKEIPKQLPGSPNIASSVDDVGRGLTQEQAVQARAERMLSQEDKWVNQNNPELRSKFENAQKNHNPASDYDPVKLGTNKGNSTEVSKNASLSEPNKARVAAHETGHYYRPSKEEGDVWNSFFDWGKLKGKTAESTNRDIRMAKEYLSGKGYYKRNSSQYGDEIRERAAQLKDYIAQKNNIPLNEDFKITEAQLDDAIKNYVKNTGLDNNMTQMLSSLKDKKGFLKAMNKYALTTTGAIIGTGAALAKQLEQKKQGGWLDNYANGGGFLMPFAQGGMVDPILKYPDGGPYTVKSGDTLWRIARQYGMTPQQIAEANSIQNINDIKVNQVLNIPILNAPVEPATPAVQPVVDADFVGPQVTPPQPRESVIQAPTNVRRVQAPVTQERVVSTRQETPQVLNVQTPKAQTQAPASTVLGEASPLFKTNEEREAWRQRLKEIAKNALSGYNNDEEYLAPLKGVINQKTGKEMTWADDENCINGICGLNKAAGMQYNAPSYMGRYIGNQTFYDNVNNKKEDYYRVNGNFQIGDHIQLTTNGANPTHSMEVYDTYVDDDGTKMYRVIHNGGTTQFKENLYSELDLKNKVARGDYIVNRPGYSLDKELLKKEREAATSPEAKAALEKKKQLVEYQTGHDPNYQYSIREDSPMFKDQPEGMKQFIKYANNVDNINKLVEKIGVDKDVIHDELLNVFGELGAENKWKNPWVGGDIAPSLVGKTLAKFLPSIPLESTIERVGSLFNLGKGQSVGPGQIKMEMLDDEAEKAKEKGVKSLKELFGIKKMSDLQDYEKVIPLMTALNIRNRQWMERKGTDLSNYLIAQPGAGLHDLKYGPGRWTPYMYRGTLKVPTTNEETKTLAHGSYADEVFHNIDDNLQRILPYKLDDGQYRGMQPVIIQAKTKKKKALGGQNNNWLNQYL